MDELIPVLEETNRLLAEYLPRSPIDLPVVISILALLAAVGVPSYIAYRQNKIALFEKRFAAYSDLLKLKNFAAILKDEQHSFRGEDIAANGADPVQIYHETTHRTFLVNLHFGSIFNYLPEKPGTPETVQSTIAAIKRIEISVNMLPLLYSKRLPNKGKDVSKEITDIFESLLTFMTEITTQNDVTDDKHRTDFIEKTDAFIEKYEERFEAGMRL